MKHLRTTAIGMICALVLTACPKPGDQQESEPAAELSDLQLTDIVIKATHGNTSNKTWVVFDRTGLGHMEIGDAFRILRTPAGAKLIPLTQLRQRWGMSPGEGVDLIVLPGNTELVGKPPKIPKHQAPQHAPDQHMILIKQSTKGPGMLDVEFYVVGNGADLVEQGMNRQFHGGTAHAEN